MHILAEDNNYQKQLLIITSDTDKAVQVSEYAVIGIQQATDSNNQQYVQWSSVYNEMAPSNSSSVEI